MRNIESPLYFLIPVRK